MANTAEEALGARPDVGDSGKITEEGAFKFKSLLLYKFKSLLLYSKGLSLLFLLLKNPQQPKFRFKLS